MLPDVDSPSMRTVATCSSATSLLSPTRKCLEKNRIKEIQFCKLRRGKNLQRVVIYTFPYSLIACRGATGRRLQKWNNVSRVLRRVAESIDTIPSNFSQWLEARSVRLYVPGSRTQCC